MLHWNVIFLQYVDHREPESCVTENYTKSEKQPQEEAEKILLLSAVLNFICKGMISDHAICFISLLIFSVCY